MRFTGSFAENHYSPEHYLKEKKHDYQQRKYSVIFLVRAKSSVTEDEKYYGRYAAYDTMGEFDVYVPPERRYYLPVAKWPVGTGESGLESRYSVSPYKKYEQKALEQFLQACLFSYSYFITGTLVKVSINVKPMRRKSRKRG